MTPEDWQMIKLLESSQVVKMDKDQLIMKQGVRYLRHLSENLIRSYSYLYYILHGSVDLRLPLRGTSFVSSHDKKLHDEPKSGKSAAGANPIISLTLSGDSKSANGASRTPSRAKLGQMKQKFGFPLQLNSKKIATLEQGLGFSDR